MVEEMFAKTDLAGAFTELALRFGADKKHAKKIAQAACETQLQADRTRARAQDKALNTAWYVFGTKKELTAQNIVKRGDLVKGTDFNKDYFTQIDLRVTKVIRLYSKSAKLLTNHPAGSYSLDKDAQGQYTLRVLDPQKFWSVSKYLVIVVK